MLGDREVVDQLAELVDAGAHSPVEQPLGQLQGVRGGRPGHVPRGRPPGQTLTRRQGPRRSLEPGACGQPEKDRTINRHYLMLAPPPDVLS